MYRYIVVGGKFGDDGKKSGYVKKLFSTMESINGDGKLVNGGTLIDLNNTLLNLGLFKVVFWFADVDNMYRPKIVKDIKKRFPKCILVTSKNNLDRKYRFLELVAKALSIKSNLFLEFTNIFSDLRKLNAAVCDPLGNCFCSSADIDEVATVLMCRVSELVKFTRMGSFEYMTGTDADIDAFPNLYSFFELTKCYAEVFHKCIHGLKTSRLLGNISFRCESGFPSIKNDSGEVFVSMRNIDKREIGMDTMVPVKFVNGLDNVKVGYSGKDKPSVDTPIQLMLYKYYRKVRYMIHSHTYITSGDAVCTNRVIPCGAVEEFYEIINLMPFRDKRKLFVNLKGHGSIAMVQDFEEMKDISYIPRPSPEF